MSQLTRVAKVLRRNNTGAGITPRQIAKAANVPLKNVYKRVSDLRLLEGRQIFSNYRTVNGQRKIVSLFVIRRMGAISFSFFYVDIFVV